MTTTRGTAGASATDSDREVGAPRTAATAPVATGSPATPGRARRPTRAELLAAYDREVPDLVRPGLTVLICGINPSLAAGATGFHFGGAANRLWATLHQAGFTDRQLDPSETDELLAQGIGITNIVNRATARADEVSAAEIRAGVDRLRAAVEHWKPRWLAFLGLGAYRIAFRQRTATVGRQAERIGETGVWLLPNPSGLNAHYTLATLAAAYRELYEASRGEQDPGGAWDGRGPSRP